ncbi:NAD(P)-binding domain-containing protein [Alphaproteobacteria bacterium]|nr:NAD(P)-binding domain-containing protein [Alphaproteobacteria bacterium]
MNIGLIGLGSMGYNLAKNLISKDFKVYAYEKNLDIIEKIEQDKITNLFLVKSLKQLINNTHSPRIIMLSLPADKIDECIDNIIELMNPEDTIADLGNSLYLKSIERYNRLLNKNIGFLGIGVSGGPRGAKNGPAIMVGGSETAWSKTKHIFNSISAKNGEQNACCYFGSPGSGHFIKLIHNGIEYALMEVLAEISVILNKAYKLNNQEQVKKFKDVLNTTSSSFLLEITTKVLDAKNENNIYFIDDIDNRIEQNGTGVWTINAALELGVSIPSIYAAVSTRSNSQYFNYDTGVNLSYDDLKINPKVNNINLEEIIFFNFACSLFQGLNLIKESNRYDFFDFNLQDVFKAWSAGCILQGEYLRFISNEFNINRDLNYNFLYKLISKKCPNIDKIRDFCSTAIKLGIPSPVLSANLAHYDLVFSNHKIGETIQLQRSYFGLHPLKQKNNKDTVKPYWTEL